MDAKWLGQQFANHPGKTKGDLAQAVGVQASAISKMLAGARQIKAKEYLLMRRFFDMPGSGEVFEKKYATIHSYADLRAEENGAQGWTGGQGGPGYEVVEVSDSSMAPDFLPGQRVLIDTNARLPDKAGVYALEDQGLVQIRMIEPVASKLKISSMAKDTQAKLVATSKVKILGRVTAKLDWL